MVPTHPRKKQGIRAESLEDEWVLHDGDTGNLHVVNEVAYFVWNLCDGDHGPEEIAGRVAESFEDLPCEEELRRGRVRLPVPHRRRALAAPLHR